MFKYQYRVKYGLIIEIFFIICLEWIDSIPRVFGINFDEDIVEYKKFRYMDVHFLDEK
jgi:hypothetical protein